MTPAGELLSWCVVANVVETRGTGADGEPLRGTHHFSPGTKVWVMPPQWGDGGEDVMVVGRHRGRDGHVRMVVTRRHLTNFRVRGVYSPAVHEELIRPWDTERAGARTWASQAEAEDVARLWTDEDLQYLT